MRFQITLFALLICLTSACNLSPSANQAIPTVPPTSIAQAEPTRTSLPTVENTEVPPTQTTTNIEFTSPATETIICTEQTSWQTYTVADGDTLFGIAQRGNTTVDTLVSANCLVDASLISVGQTLYVPSAILPPVGNTNNENQDNIQNDPNRYTTELWWIIQGDNGRAGFPVGCGDSIYLQQSGIPANLSQNDTINRAFDYLNDDTNFGAGQGDRGWWNPLSTTSLFVNQYTVNGNRVTVDFGGELLLRGVCFDAQIEAQIALNIMSLTGTRSATITVNGRNMREIFDTSGLETRISYTWDEFQNSDPIAPQTQVQFWLGSETNGVVGAVPIGCESFLTPINTDRAVSNDLKEDLTFALSTLFDPNRSNPSTVYIDYLNQQGLSVQNIVINGSHVTVTMGGEFLGIGVCGDPIIEGQVLYTIFQFDEIQSAKVIINNDGNLRRIVDQRDVDVSDYIYTRSDLGSGT